VLILHLNLLVQCRLLSDKVRHFQSNITQLNTREKHSALNRLPNFPLVQLQACGEIQTRGVHRLMSFIIWLSLITTSLIVLISIQIVFLPYQGDWFTWNHRTVLLLDVAALLFMWCGIYSANRWNKVWLFGNTALAV